MIAIPGRNVCRKCGFPPSWHTNGKCVTRDQIHPMNDAARRMDARRRRNP